MHYIKPLAMVKIEKVSPDGPLGPSRVAPGDALLRVNGTLMRDLLDVRFAAADDDLDIEFQRPNGSRFTLTVEKHPDEDLGLVFEPMPIRSCNNECDFCFVFQQPKKTMRRDLYIMDDDYRYSFLYGNFITLTNVDEEDIVRIIDQRLSPLYISVHSTVDTVRREFLRSPKAPPIMPLLKRLADAGIRMHTQVVVIPDFNDGDTLETTITDLASLYPMVESLAVVPVGLTQYRVDLPSVNTVSRAYARTAVKMLRSRGNVFRQQFDTEFLYVADEFFVIAGLPFPRAPYYDDFSQVENGIGMSRLLLDHFAAGQNHLPESLDQPLKLYWVTGASAATFVLPRIVAPLNKIDGLEVIPVVARNRYYGASVTVSGLLIGQDIVLALQEASATGGVVLLPPNCLNDEGHTLDDLTAGDLSRQLGMPVQPTSYDFLPQLRSWLLSPRELGTVSL
jgi:putative radical SAM enzyme (TIGR03279 family)